MATTETKSAFAEKMQMLLQDVEDEINDTEDQLDQFGVEARAAHEQHVKELRSRMAAAQTRLQQLHSADEAQWEKTKAEIERAWSDLKQSLKDTAARMRQG